MKKKDMRGFLVKKFLLVILNILTCEFGINLLYSFVIFPFLRNEIGGPFFEHLGQGTFGFSALYSVFFWLFSKAVLAVLPDVLAESAYQFIYANLGIMLPQGSEGITDSGHNVMALYYVGCLLILLVLFLGFLLPYIVGALQFSRIIHHQMQELWKAEKEQQQKTSRQRNLMLSDIAHDLKTPITTINGYAQALRDEVVADEEKKKQYLNAICTKSQRMDELISLLFEYVKIDSEGFCLHKEKTDIVESLRENVALFYADFERKGIEVELDIPEQRIWWQIDRIQFSRALANLLSNELRHVEQGQHVLVRLKWNKDVGRIHILFGDTGEQIPDEMAKHVFEPFVVGDASRSTKGGSGLGLSISSKIVRMHGGRLLLDRNSTAEYTKAFLIVLWGGM